MCLAQYSLMQRFMPLASSRRRSRQILNNSLPHILSLLPNSDEEAFIKQFLAEAEGDKNAQRQV